MSTRTNAVKFGRFGIVLEKEQLMYYMDGELTRVTDVSHEFSFEDLYQIASKISNLKETGTVQFVHKNDIINDRKK